MRADDVLGYTEPYRLITVAAGEAGVIGEVLVREGDQVKQGQVLAKLDTAVLAAELEIARAEAKLAGTRMRTGGGTFGADASHSRGVGKSGDGRNDQASPGSKD